MDAMNGVAWAAGFAAGLLGAMGLGGGSVLILYLTLCAGLPQIQAQGMNLMFFLPCAAAAVLMHSRRHQIDWRLWCRTAPVGVLGAWAGAWLGTKMGGELLQKGFAVFLLLFGCAELLHRKSRRSE